MFLTGFSVLGWFNNAIHMFLLWLDQSVYWFAAQCYQLFMKLATAQIFTDDFFAGFANRIYAILGVFMLFYLVYALLNAIVDPDKLTKGDKGVGKIASNLVVSLVLLGLMPSIFSYAYRMQNFVLSSNLLGAVILGSDVIDVSDSDSIKENEESLIRFGDYVSFSVLNAFLNPENVNPTLDGGYNWYGLKEEILKKGLWTSIPSTMANAVSNGVSIDGVNTVITYRPIISTAAGVFLIYILLSFTLDLGIRVVKFAFYQLLAPIPIILRIIPSKKGAFDKWLKQTLSVYFEVFIRVALMYIAIYFINAITTNNNWYENGGEMGILAFAILIMGVFAFAKQAPKIISDVLGLDTGNLKLGIKDKLKAGGFVGAGALAGIGLAKSGFGHVGGAISGAAGGLYGSLVNGAGLAGLGYGAINGWKSKGGQFNNQRKKFYTEAMHGDGQAGWFGNRGYIDKLNADMKTNAEKKYTETVKRRADKFRESDSYQNYAKNIVQQAQDNYDALKTNFDSKNAFRENYQKSSEYQGIMSRFENESKDEARKKIMEDFRNGAYNNLNAIERRTRMAEDEKKLTENLQHAKTYEELKRLANMGASSANAMRYISNVESFSADTQAINAANEELQHLKKDRMTEGSALAQAEEFFTDSANKDLSEDIKQFQKDLEYVEQRDTDKAVKTAKKTKEFQVQAAAYEAALKNINNSNSSKGTTKPSDKK